MIESPRIVQTEAMPTAVIRIRVPRSEIQNVMGPAIGEVIAAVSSQGIGPAGSVFSLHHKMDAEQFDFEVGVPVTAPVQATGRVVASEIPARRVVRAVYRGGYEGLGDGWAELDRWITAEGYATEPGLWERYSKGPESTPDPSAWETELNKPLLS
ncbi:MAG: GyrI-like domain-containing protein [Chloroflexota bacterium]